MLGRIKAYCLHSVTIAWGYVLAIAGSTMAFIDNIGDRNKLRANLDRTTQARVAARWTPTSRLTVDASVTYEKSRAYEDHLKKESKKSI